MKINSYHFICRIFPLKSLNRTIHIYSIKRCQFLHTISNASSSRVPNKSVQDYKQFLLQLNKKEIKNLQTALEQTKSVQGKAHEPPSSSQLRLVVMQCALPFVGFGFLDNLIMILAGEYIDMTIGVSLGISTMAAAACGNLVSDLFGLGLADYVESLCRRFGLPNPELSSFQMEASSVRWAQRLGRVLGITVGCIIGMFPLLWFEDDHCHHDNKEEKS